MIDWLVAGLLAIAPPSRHLTEPEARRYAEAVVSVAAETGEDPWLLVGLARNESDLRPDAVGPDGRDCGITQTRTRSPKRCDELRRDVRLGFAEAARELASARRSCRFVPAGERRACTLNRYNSGYRKAACAPGDAACARRARVASRYWLRVTCFAEAARAGQSGRRCRQIWRVADLPARAGGGALVASRGGAP